MDFIVIGVTAFIASGLTFFSGFGLGTVLLAAFALFFSAPAAVAATGTVHLLNNLFKGVLVFRTVDWPTVARFAIGAIPAAAIGALVLGSLSDAPAFRWSGFGYDFVPTVAGVVIGAAMIGFAALEALPWFQKLALPPRLLPLGGALSGFMGGMTGQQGALRSLVLLKCGLDAKQFIATGVMVAILIDLTRLPTYLASFDPDTLDLTGREGALIAVGTACAFAGAWLGSKYLKRATIGVVRFSVATLMLVIGLGMILGILGG